MAIEAALQFPTSMVLDSRLRGNDDLQNILPILIVPHYPSFLHSQYASTYDINNPLIVRRKQYRRAQLVDLLQDAHYLERIDRIEVPCRLIGDDDVRLSDYGARNSDSLALAAGKLAGKIPDLMADVHELEHVRNVGRDLAVAAASCFHGKGDVLIHGLIGDEAIFLEDGADAAAQLAHGALAELMDVRRLEEDRAFARPILCYEHFHERRLACAGMADNGHEFFWFHAKADRIESNRFVGIDFGDFIVVDHRLIIAPSEDVRQPIGTVSEPRRFRDDRACAGDV